jgi:hypothetical protein
VLQEVNQKMELKDELYSNLAEEDQLKLVWASSTSTIQVSLALSKSSASSIF